MIRRRRRTSRLAAIDIAPLVDCIFLLLVFFMLASTFSRESEERQGALAIELPGSRHATDAPERVIRLDVDESGRLALDGESLAVEDLAAAFRRRVAETGRVDLLLVADRRARLEVVTTLLDEARGAGVASVCLATRPGGDP